MLKQILIVEDDLDFATVLRDYLRKQGFYASVESTVAGAIQYLIAHSVEVVLSDINFPGGGALALINEIKTKVSYSPKMIFITGMNPKGSGLSEDDSNIILEKPIAMSKLLAVIDAISMASARDNQWVFIDPKDITEPLMTVTFEGMDGIFPIEIVEIEDSLFTFGFKEASHYNANVMIPGASLSLRIRVISKASNLDMKIDGNLSSKEEGFQEGFFYFKPTQNNEQALIEIDKWYSNHQSQVSDFLKAAKGR